MAPLISALIVTLLIGVPVAICFGIAAVIGLVAWGNVSLVILPQRMFAGVDSFPFLAIPFFILVGELMSSGGITQSLISFCNSLIGRIRGGLAQVNVLTNMVFAGISGSATADAAAIGTVLVPAMEKEGYDRPFSAAVTAAASIMGPIMPPSIAMVIYSLVLNGTVSITGLFLAGIGPGLLLGASVSITAYYLAVKRGYPISETPFSVRNATKSFGVAIPALIAPVIIVGGLVGGVFTATEAAAVVVVYVLLLGFAYTRKLTMRSTLTAIERAMIMTAVVALILATSEIFTWMMTAMHIPKMVNDLAQTWIADKFTFSIVFLIFMIIAGIFIEPVPLMVMFAPVLAPIAYGFGFDPLHFGVMFVVAAEIGMITPPVGTVLFIMCGVSRVPLSALSRAIWPFVVAQVVVLLLVVFLPDICVWLPNSLGYR